MYVDEFGINRFSQGEPLAAANHIMRVSGFLCALSILAFVLWGGCRFYSSVQFDIHCGDYLKRAANSNTIELAHQNLDVAINYTQQNGLTQGNTAALWETPQMDVGFWYQNLTASLGELETVKPTASPLEKSNVLMKLRETLLDSNSSGDTLAVPDGIDIFPHNTLFFWWGWVSFLLAAGFGIFRLLTDDGY